MTFYLEFLKVTPWLAWSDDDAQSVSLIEIDSVRFVDDKDYRASHVCRRS
jgi:hypothetical protein